MTIHNTDKDCTLDADDGCTVCGVYHGDRCDECGGRGFHVDGCSEIEHEADVEAEQEAVGSMHFDLRDLADQLEAVVWDAPADADGAMCAEVLWDGYPLDEGRFPAKTYLPALAAMADVLIVQRDIARSEAE